MESLNCHFIEEHVSENRHRHGIPDKINIHPVNMRHCGPIILSSTIAYQRIVTD